MKNNLDYQNENADDSKKIESKDIDQVFEKIQESRQNLEKSINTKEIIDFDLLQKNLIESFSDRFNDFTVKDLMEGCMETFEIKGLLEQFEAKFKEETSNNSMMIKAMVVLEGKSTEEVLDSIIQDIIMDDVEYYFAFVIGSTVHEFQKNNYPNIEFKEFESILLNKHPRNEYIPTDIQALFHNAADKITEELQERLKDTIRINKDKKTNRTEDIVINQKMEDIIENRFQSYISKSSTNGLSYIDTYLKSSEEDKSEANIILECFDFEDILPGIKKDITKKMNFLESSHDEQYNNSIIRIRGELYNNKNYNKLASIFLNNMYSYTEDENTDISSIYIVIEKILPFLTTDQLFEYLGLFAEKDFEIKTMIIKELNDKITLINTNNYDDYSKLINKYNTNANTISEELYKLSEKLKEKTTTEKLQFISLIHDLSVYSSSKRDKLTSRYHNNITRNLSGFMSEISDSHFVKYFALSSKKEILAKDKGFDELINYGSFKGLRSNEWKEKIEKIKEEEEKESNKIINKMGDPLYITSRNESFFTEHYKIIKISKDYYGFSEINKNSSNEGIKKIAKCSNNPEALNIIKIENIKNEEELNPFVDKVDDDFFQLIRYLHLPRIKYLIEEDLGIKLKEITLETQIHLLRFLEDKELDSFDRLKKILKNNPENKEYILKSFLACSEDKKLGNAILDLGEIEETDEIFDVYDYSLSNARDQAHNLCGLYNSVKSDTPYAPDISYNELYKLLLSSTNDILKNSLPKLQKINDINLPNKTELIKNEVENICNLVETEIESRYQFSGEFKEVNNGIAGKQIGIFLDLIRNVIPQTIKEIKLKTKNKLDSTGEKRMEEIENEFYLLERDLISDRPNTMIILLNKIKEAEKEMYGLAQIKHKENEKFKELGTKYNKFLSTRKSFLKKIKALAEKNNITIPSHFAENILNNKDAIETIDTDKKLYFPVGISKEVEQYKEVIEGGKDFVKPIDIYNYLFWLENQGQKVELIICDEMQESNYKLLNNTSLEEGKNIAIQAGKLEYKFYQSVIDTFNLNNIKLTTYKELTDNNKFQEKLEFCNKLAKHPLFKNAFFQLKNDRFDNETENTEENDLLNMEYGKTEVAWILSKDGMKISHPKEAKIGYDGLALVIQNIEIQAEKQGIDNIFDQDIKTINKFLHKVLTKIQIDIKSKIKDKSLAGIQKSYYQKMNAYLFGQFNGKDGINIPAAFAKKERKLKIGKIAKKIDFNYYCPHSTNSQSFDTNENIDRSDFKEPYSTYFLENFFIPTFFESNQIPASPSPKIFAGLISKQSFKKQKEYMNNILTPLLKQYFHHLGKVPASYFEDIKKTRNELETELRKAKTIIDVIDFIRINIIIPVENRKKETAINNETSYEEII